MYMKTLLKYKKELALWPILAVIWLELWFHVLVFGGVQGIGFAVLSGAFVGGVVALVCAVLPEKLRGILMSGLLLVAGVFSCAQLVYFKVFGSLMQLSLIGMGGDVFATFGSIIVSTILRNCAGILLLMLPFGVSLVMLLKKAAAAMSVKKAAIAAVAGLALMLLCGVLAVGGVRSPFDVMTDKGTTTEYAYQRLGLSMGVVRDLAGTSILRDEGYSAGIESGDTDRAYDPEEYNVLDIDFAALSEGTDNGELKALNEYFSAVTPTKKNEYTGLLEGYNIVTVCAESFSPYLVDEELTPTLYKLSTNGIIFENFYGSFQSLTSNGEYTMCMGLYPNMVNTSGATTFEDSIGNYVPFCLGNSLSAMGYDCYAYHSNVGEFYSRNLTHPNMGYTFRCAGNGIDIKIQNPASDIELFKQSVADFAESDKPFHAYYMSWSGHNPYNWTNGMSEKHREEVAHLPYSDGVKAYLACNLELEYALQYLMEVLEDAGVADKTVIALTTDHFPYGLTEAEYNELAGMEVETVFEKYRSSFICYVPDLEENIYVSEYCSTADILPTLLNLLGAPYDSRLLAGRDVLSDGMHVAVLSNKSFITDTFRFNTGEGKLPDDTVTDSHGYTQKDYADYIDNLFAVSASIPELNYYTNVFGVEGKGEAVEELAYEDIENVFHKSAVRYVTTENLMEADSETLFGGGREATVGELAEVFYRVAYAESEASSMEWAMDCGLLKAEEGYTAETVLDHIDCAVLMYRFSVMQGMTEIEVPEDVAASYPDFDRETLAACLWATNETIINKSMDYIYGSGGVGLNRFQLAAYVSYLCTH